jgi:CRISPR-associated protein Cmr6
MKMSSNLGWMFYKDYFKDLNYDNFSSQENKNRINMKINTLLNSNPELESNEDEKLLGNLHLKATTTYPGLLLGSGNMHKLPSDIEGQLILGFHFDYTTGLPVIQGSSIKGVLRSAFEHKEYIQELLDNRFNSDEIDGIEKEIFDNGDIFFDAVVIKKGSTLLSDDYLAPHNNELKVIDQESGEIIEGQEDDYLAPHNNELKEPIPLRFLKVSPNVTFRFDFELKDNKFLSKEEKKNLFIEILKDLGVGAKTNVGYGKFDNIEIHKTEEEKKIERREEDKKVIDKANSVEELEQFIRNNQTSELLDEAKIKLENFEEEKEKELLKQSWENIDKSKKQYIESFIKKNENNNLAKEYVLEAKNLLDNSNNQEQSEFNLSQYTKFKPLDSYLKKFKSLSEKEIDSLKNHLLNNMQDKIKRKKFPFITLQKFISKEEANEIADKLNLK